MSIRRRNALMMASGLLAGALMVLSFPPTAGSQEIELKFGHSDTPDSHIGRGITRFAELVKAKSNGRLNIKVYSGNQLGGTRDMLENVQLGTIAMVAIGADLLGNSVPEADILTFPYLYRDWDHVFAAVDGPIGKRINDLTIKKIGVRIAASTIHGTRELYTKGLEINSIEDFSKIKVRVSQRTHSHRGLQGLRRAPDSRAVARALHVTADRSGERLRNAPWLEHHPEIL